MIRAVALFLTVLTGFSGLVYEVTWQKYLATLLGSHSEATAAVLGIFLGGLALGYWLFGLVTHRVVARAEAAGKLPRLLLLYGVIEAGIGLYVLAFPWLFRGIQEFSYSIPHGAGGIGFAIDVLLAVVLIGPASVLMGGTIPILTQSLARSLADATRFHAFVYAFNTAGAFAGALAAGFYLVPQLGLENVMFAMGMINLFAGSIFMTLGVRGRAVVSLAREAAPTEEGGEERKRAARIEGFGSYVTVALLTGFAMMTIQTTVIRLGGLAFGSSQFTFSMVVAVFVLSIALGSFMVSSLTRIPKIVVVLNQWGIALLFLLLYSSLPKSGYWVYLVRVLFRETNAGFLAYYSVGFLGVLIVIGLPVMLSGAALPLLFHRMRREVSHLGDLAGTLYSWNTVGSLLGALLGGYALFFWLDLHQVYRLAVATLFVAAVVLSIRVYSLRRARAAAMLIIVLGVVALLPAWKPQYLHAGLFRKRPTGPEIYVGFEKVVNPDMGVFTPRALFHTDDPIASVLVREQEHPGAVRVRSIITDGKSDGNTVGDYKTTGLLAVLPAMLAEKAERAFVIGWGTGITAGELASFESMREVDVAEISPGVLEAAPFFDFVNLSASTNHKTRTIASDAYRALMRSEGTYDVIVSEPSHVWAAGVEMLFSREFLEAARSKLSPGGVFCQFIHRYENDDDTVALVLRTFASAYDDVAVWSDVNDSLFLLGFESSGRAADHYRLAQQAERPDFKATLERTSIMSFPALLAHEVLPVGVVHAADLRGPLHSLYHPRINYLAGRAFFRGDHGELPFTGFGEAARVGARNSMLRGYVSRLEGGLSDEERTEMIFQSCRVVGPLCNTLLARWLSEDADSPALESALELVGRSDLRAGRGKLEEMARLFSLSPIRPGETVTVAEAERASALFVRSYHHVAPFRPEALLDIWSGCRDARATEESCREQAKRSALDSDEAGASFKDAVQECLAGMYVGERCQDGSERARILVEEGRLPE
jgi:spermidine synthase